MKVLSWIISNWLVVMYYVLNVVMLLYMIRGTLMTIDKLVEFLGCKKT